ncbi:hypothetical protein Lal_00049321, partial [Lupinus albus]
MNLLVRKFSKFIKRKGGFKKFHKKEAKESTNKGKNNKDRFTCHECGKAGHMRFQCPTYLKKVDSEKSTPREFKSKKAYIVWDVPEEETTSSTSSEEESAKLCLMVRSDNNGNSDSHEDNDEVYSDTSSTSDDLPSYELHEELKKLARINVDKKREILRNEKKLSQLQKELNELKLENETLDLIYSCNTCDCSADNSCQKPVCETCEILQEDNLKLKEKLERLTNSKQQLDTLLSQTRNVGDRTGLGYTRSAKNKRLYRKPVVNTKNKNHKRSPTCFYCNTYGHTSYSCYIRKYGIPSGAYIWIKKGDNSLITNRKGPNIIWVCLRTQGQKWYLDSGCSRHMTGDRSNFLDLSLKGKGYVTYGDNNKGKILGTGTVGNSSHTQIENVLYVEGLEHNLLSISQLCDK